jgi:hypothetical protein
LSAALQDREAEEGGEKILLKKLRDAALRAPSERERERERDRERERGSPRFTACTSMPGRPVASPSALPALAVAAAAWEKRGK